MNAQIEARQAAKPEPTLLSTRGWIGFGLGSNLGDSRWYLSRALDALVCRYGALRIAPLYSTEPISAIEQDDFLNTVALAPYPTADDPVQDQVRRALGFAKNLERQAGRRSAERDSPRALDVDLLFWGEHRLSLGSLPGESAVSPGSETPWPGAIEVPHPRLTERRFVLAPLVDLAPNLLLDGKPVRQLLDQVSDQSIQGLDWNA